MRRRRRRPRRRPNSSQGTIVISQPCRASRLIGSRTALCSEAAVTRWLPRRVAARASPLIARLFDSVAPEVKTISRASAPMARATCSRARSTASAASQPNRCETLAGIAVKLSEIRNHGLDDPGIGPRRRMIVKVDRVRPHAIPPLSRQPDCVSDQITRLCVNSPPHLSDHTPPAPLFPLAP